jgi:precorrin-6Y C5,15-methyltransferase (decarboxylating)
MSTVPWLAVIGLGEDGVGGLSQTARALIAGAELLVGGARHLALVPEGAARRIAWLTPLAATVAVIAEHRFRPVVVLATGDPLCYGIGVTLARRFPAAEMLMLPQPSAFSLAAARLCWPLAQCVTLTLHGRPLEQLLLHLAPGARLLILSHDAGTPAAVAALLRDGGWGPSLMTVLEHLGGPREAIRSATADTWPAAPGADLNTLAIECRPGPGARPLSRFAGLPDDAFAHDGQITKRVVRAASLAALAPLPGELLWDVGAGSGAIAIEWLRGGRGLRAIAIERQPKRCALIARNAAALGVPRLELVAGEAPAALAGLPAPDAVFLGGGSGAPRMRETLWQALRPGGRLVANAVTVAGEARLARWQGELGGELTRIAVQHAAPVGAHLGWRPQLTVTQWLVVKPGLVVKPELVVEPAGGA